MIAYAALAKAAAQRREPLSDSGNMQQAAACLADLEDV
jgi:hypothetical protein